ncbi:MAG: nicotinamide-nucleotide amidohydrolase family protein [candidate division WOR-3 bacterium]
MISILLIGDELLEGFTNEKNLFIISNFLRSFRKQLPKKAIIVKDNKEEIVKAVRNLLDEKPKVIITTGGIGPTEDDLTIESISYALNLNLVKTTFETEIEKYKYVIDGFKLIKNPRGKAPAQIGYYQDVLIIILPGVPYEIEGFLNESEIGKILIDVIEEGYDFLIIKTNGIYETKLREILLPHYEKLGFFGYLPRNDGVYLKFKGNKEKLNEIKSFLDNLLKDYIWGYDDDRIEVLLGNLLKRNNLRISIAESFTGGKVSNLITSVPGSSNYFKGSIVAYSKDIKKKILNVRTENIYSKDCVIEMAKNVKELFNSDIGISTSGVAGPDKDDSVEVGTCFFGISFKENLAFEYKFSGTRMAIIEKGAYFILYKLYKCLLHNFQSD